MGKERGDSGQKVLLPRRTAGKIEAVVSHIYSERAGFAVYRAQTIESITGNEVSTAAQFSTARRLMEITLQNGGLPMGLPPTLNPLVAP
jgi:hypothetical protein